MNRMMLRTQKRKGFTIIELLIVVIVIGVLAAAGIGKYQGFAENARAKTCTMNQATIENGVGMWCTQNTALSEAAEGGIVFNRNGYNYGWFGTVPTFGNTYNIGNVIRDNKTFLCPKILTDYVNVVENVPQGWYGHKCLWGNYIFYYNGPGYGLSFNGSWGYWYDPANNNQVGHQLVWCGGYGGYSCDRAYPEIRKYIHSTKWGAY